MTRSNLTPDMTHTQEALTWRNAFGVATPAPDTAGFQLGLIDEEFTEFLEANAETDEAHTLKELADVVFTAYQFAAAKGWNLDLALTRVFESNMSKLDIDGQPIKDASGKIRKGPGYFEPQLTDLIP
jgi:predicted HAD superfamily Cof-like phosphohydrolase